jgi:hypothetical protein
MVTGLAWGFGATAVPLWPGIAVPVAAGVLLIGMARREQRLLKEVIAALAFMVAGLTPWLYRNYTVFGFLTYVRTNYALELSVSNHDGAFPDAERNYTTGYPNNYFYRNHPGFDADAARRVQQLGEVEFNRERASRAFSWIRAHPAQFVKLTLARIVMFWVTPTRWQPVKSLFLLGITILGFLGFVLFWRREPFLGLPLAAAMLTYPIPLYFVQMDTRYRYPIDWVIYLFAAYALYTAAYLWLSQNRPERAGGGTVQFHTLFPET